MLDVANISFKGDKPQKEVVYVSKDPDRAVNAAGVIAGTSGMIGGAVLGGTVGVCKIPGQTVKTIANFDYAKVIKDSFDSFKSKITNASQLQELKNAFKTSDAAAVNEEILAIAKTLTERLHGAFAHDADAAAVVDKVIDPVVNSLSVKKNFMNYGSLGLKEKIKSPKVQTILKIFGFNRKTSKIAKGITGNVAEGFAIAVENIKNFTPEEKQAWNKVAKQMFSELENNNSIRVSKNFIKAIVGMGKDTTWLSESFKDLQTGITDGIKTFDSDIAKIPLKTIGKYSAIGALSCTAVSLLGWLCLKGSLMKKEKAEI